MDKRYCLILIISLLSFIIGGLLGKDSIGVVVWFVAAGLAVIALINGRPL